MAAPEEYQVVNVPITSHTFNADRSRQSILFTISSDFSDLVLELAVSLNSNDAQIMSRQGQEWKVTETLSEVLGLIRPLSIINWLTP
jgi:actin related protein 2/3 complex subunit 1A/1B